MPGRRAVLLVLGAAVGTLFLYLAVRRLDWAAFTAEIGRAHAGQIAIGMVCLFTYYGVKAERWKHLVAPFARASGLAQTCAPGSCRTRASVVPCARASRARPRRAASYA